MATEPRSQRVYQAACPNCGAPVEFRSAASAFAVCSYCRGTVVREGDALRKIGESAELFDDHSPLQLGAAGAFQGAGFVLVGRLQYGYENGSWNEWHALFDNQRSGWLSEDNGRYVFSFEQPIDGPVPSAKELRPGVQRLINRQVWTTASVSNVKLLAAQGELPTPPNTSTSFAVADLRNRQEEVGTLDYSAGLMPTWSVGRTVSLPDLRMTGLATGAMGGASEKTLKGRSITCPSCGTSLDIKLSTTKSIVCHQCHAVVDLTLASDGVGQALAHYAQDNGSEPQIPLGTPGALALGEATARSWQVVGYAERCEIGDDEQSFWREYLLYNREQGFAFLVDAEDGWSWAIPITGTPDGIGNKVTYRGESYREMYTYGGKTTYVLGEFYWQLKRGEITHNIDYQGIGSASRKRLNQERTGDPARDFQAGEIVWSAGETLSADAVMKAFRLSKDKLAAMERDSSPVSSNAGALLAKVFVWMFVVAVVIMMFRCDSDDGCNSVRSTYGESSREYQSCLANRGSGHRSSGGSFGGFSSGGGHK